MEEYEAQLKRDKVRQAEVKYIEQLEEDTERLKTWQAAAKRRYAYYRRLAKRLTRTSIQTLKEE